jgi:hypothetical protein
VRDYQRATWLEPGPWPWCAAFACWVLRKWANEQKKPEGWRCRDASAFGWEKWATKNGIEVLPETAQAKAGDIVIFDFSHIGFVIEDQIGDYIECCEGNTNVKGTRDSAGGDGVWLKTRHKSLTKCYVRIEA